ncbi:MAG: hypothetical protein AB8G11_17860 [Saprospiraceae bacterium]
MKLLTFSFCLLFSQITVAQSINLEQLEGKWYINMTNFPINLFSVEKTDTTLQE